MKHAGWALTLAVVAWPGLASAAPASLCTEGETAVFTCASGAKLISVCASRDLSSRAGTLAYRFGPPGKPEMSWPPPDRWRRAVGSGTWAFSGGGGAWLAFHREAYRYVVYTAIGQGWGSKAGVAVEKGGKVIANLACQGKPVSDLGPDFFHRAGIADDPADFDLP